MGYWKLVKGTNTKFAALPPMPEKNRKYLEERGAMKWYETCLDQLHIDDPGVTVNGHYQLVDSQNKIHRENIYYALQ